MSRKIRRKTGGRILIVIGSVALISAVGIASAANSRQASNCDSGTAAQIDACNGQPLPTLPTTPTTLPALSQWAPYGSSLVVPNPPLAFATATQGWMVSGIDSSSQIDDNLSAGYEGQIWPGTGIAATADGGDKWSNELSVPTGIWGIDALNSQDVWIVGVDSLYASDNGGDTWTALSTDEAAGTALMRVNFLSPSVGVGVTSSGQLETSTDAGRTWQVSQATAAGSLSVTDTCLSGSSVLASDRNGDIYSTPATGTPTAWTNVYAAPQVSPNVEYTAELSCDPSGGRAWEMLNPVDPQSSGGSPVISESPSASGQWSTTSSAAAASSSSEAVAIGQQQVPVAGSSSPLAFVAGSDGEGVFESSNGIGFSASQVSGQFAGGNGDSIIFHGASFLNSELGWFYADVTTPPSSPSSGPTDTSFVYATADGGATWSQVWTQDQTSWSPEGAPNS